MNKPNRIANPLHFLNAAPVLLLWAIAAIVYIVSSILYFQIPINPDDAVFTYIAWVMSEGGTVYIDAADQNWPGQMLIHWLAVVLFGNSLWAYRGLEIIILLPLCSWALYCFTDAVYDRFAAIFVALLFPIMYMLAGFWHSGQRDMIAGPILIATCLIMYRRFLGATWRCLLLQGLLIGLATMIRPTMLIIGPLLFLLDVFFMSKHQRSLARVFIDHCVVLMTILCFAALLMLYGHFTGSLGAWYEASILFATQVYSQSINAIDSLARVIPNLLNAWKLYLLVGVVGVFLLAKKNKVALCLIASILPAALISLLVQGKALSYHMTVLYAPLSIVLAVALSFSFRVMLAKKTSSIALILAIVLFSVTALGVVKKSFDTFASPFNFLVGISDRDKHLVNYVAGNGVTVSQTVLAAEYIEQTTPQEATVLFWARPMHVNIVSGRRSPLREASIALLLEPTPNFSIYSLWYDRIETIFKQSPPEIILLVKDDTTGVYVGFDQQNPDKGFSNIVAQNLRFYQKETTFGNVELFRRR